jgi:hypothetical protein
MSYRSLSSFFLCAIIVIFLCLIAGCTSNQEKAGTVSQPAVIPETQVTIVTPSVMQFTKQTLNLTINENAQMHAGNLTLDFSVKDKTRDPVKQTVSFELTVKNVGNETVADLQKKLSELYASDRTGKQYSVPTHVALIGLKPGESRSGTVEIANVPDQALPGLIFHYKFGNDEASWIIIPDTPL